MADGVAVKGLGVVIQAVRGGGDLIVVLLKETESDANLRTRATLDAVLAEVANTEADFTNYTRKTIANASITVVEDASGTPVDLQVGNLVWTSAGGTTDNSLVKLLVCLDGATDTDRTLFTFHDFVATTDGNDLTAVEHADGFYSALQGS